jgi:RND family efflux transporter MFP subunit
MKKKELVTYIALAVFLCGIGGILTACQQSGGKDKNPLSEKEKESVEVHPEVVFAIADDKPIYQYVESQGVVEANQSVQLKPKISGYVERSSITEGRRVRKGDTLLQLDRREYAVALQQARNDYEKAKQKYNIEMGMRAGRNSPSDPHGKQDSSTQMVRISTGLAQAELDVKKAQLNLSYTSLVASFSGVLSTDQRLAPGTFVTAGTQVGQLVDDRKIRIRFDVLESELGKVGQGMTTQLTGPGGEQMQGMVESVAPVVNSKTKTGTVVVSAGNQGGVLSPGMTVDGRIQILKQQGKVRVPRSAILSRDGGRTLLFKLNPENNEVNWVYVKLVAENSVWAIINNPQVEPGDTIAVDQHFALSHLEVVKPRMQLQNRADSLEN